MSPRKKKTAGRQQQKRKAPKGGRALPTEPKPKKTKKTKKGGKE